MSDYVRKTDITNSEIQVPVDIQSSYIMVPVDIQGQAIDVIIVPKYSENTTSVASIDAETLVLDLDVRLYKNLGLSLSNTGANDLVYRITALTYYSGTIETEIVSSTTLAAGAKALQTLDVSKYARIKLYVAAAVAGSPSDITVEYILKG